MVSNNWSINIILFTLCLFFVRPLRKSAMPERSWQTDRSCPCRQKPRPRNITNIFRIKKFNSMQCMNLDEIVVLITILAKRTGKYRYLWLYLWRSRFRQAPLVPVSFFLLETNTPFGVYIIICSESNWVISRFHFHFSYAYLTKVILWLIGRPLIFVFLVLFDLVLCFGEDHFIYDLLVLDVYLVFDGIIDLFT